MSEHVLSQEEIDALLRGEEEANEPTMLDTEPIVQLFESVLEHVASVVSPVADKQFGVGRVVAELMTWEELKSQLISPLCSRIEYEGDIDGMQLSIADGSTQQQLRAMGETEPITMLNKMVLALAAGLENQLRETKEGFRIQTQISSFEPLEESHDDRIAFRSAQMCVVLQVSLQGDGGDVAWREVLPRDLAKEIITLLRPEEVEIAHGAESSSQQSGQSSPQGAAATTADTVGNPGQSGPVPVTPVQFTPLGEGSLAGDPANIGLIMDVPLRVTVELGRKQMLVRDVLDLGKGSLIELDKLAGEPVDVFVNGKLIAKGEVVVIDENFGVKVTSIVTPVERLQNLQ